METKLARISQLSKENPDMVFTSLGHLINKEMLQSCHLQMDGEKAVGIDGVTKEEYSRNLDENIENLVERLKKKSYKPKPARLVEIPKDNGKTRPLSIYCYEDKLVQEALRRILEAVFEPLFYDEMMGFRPNRGCHRAIRKLNTMLERKPTSYVLDADVKGFFQHLDHEWIIRFIESKGWRWAAGRDPVNYLDLNKFVEKTDTSYYQIISDKTDFVYVPKKEKLSSDEVNKYHLGKRDGMYNNIGSAFSIKVAFGNNNSPLVEGILTVSTYGKHFTDNIDIEKADDVFKRMIIDEIFPYYKRLIELEFGMLYLRHVRRDVGE